MLFEVTYDASGVAQPVQEFLPTNRRRRSDDNWSGISSIGTTLYAPLQGKRVSTHVALDLYSRMGQKDGAVSNKSCVDEL